MPFSLRLPARVGPLQDARALGSERYTVYCATDRIEISFWDLGQMKVRRGLDVCQLASRSDSLRFVERNFGDEGVSRRC